MSVIIAFLFVVWIWSLIAFARWRARAIEAEGGSVDLLHDWATQLYSKGGALALLMLLIAMK